MANQYKQATFLKCDVDQNQDISQDQGIRAMPTFKVYKGGKVVATILGANASDLEDAIQKHAGPPSKDSSTTHNWGSGQTLGDSANPSIPILA
ncbi:MAG: hypothetical protein CYPHOPRED_000409 [Cyphobasidiales sp. Tagirdzhanova-0007]|nr:MAG: hypothetical protein CYPHOPRED_000409 [Cyphobasidiales sp. Tagirdzhanova-0007]